MPLKLNSTGGGSVTLDVPSTASAYTITVPAITGTAVVTGSTATVSQAMLAAGVAGNGPAFYVYPSTNQNVTATTFTKVTFDSEFFDTANNFDTSTNRFTPNVAGYYQINCRLAFATVANMTDCFASLYKNGSEYARLGGAATGGSSSVSAPSGSTIVYMNGTTDYLELYAYQANATNTTLQTNAFGPSSTHLSGALVRSA